MIKNKNEIQFSKGEEKVTTVGHDSSEGLDQVIQSPGV
jgi:hypothetical protein